MNDLLEGGCLFQGPVEIVNYDEDGREHLLYEGEGEDIPRDTDWGEASPCFIYWDRYGEFELQEPYKTMLEEARLMATRGWRNGLYDYLEPRCRYNRDQLNDALLRICQDESRTAFEKMDDFVVRALEGDL